VGEGFLIGRAWAKRETGIPENVNEESHLGHAYNEKFSWLTAYGLADIDQAARSNLMKLRQSPAALAWHAGLKDEKRQKLNHPTTIMRAWKRHDDESAFPKPGYTKKQETAQQHEKGIIDEATKTRIDGLRKEVSYHRVAAQDRSEVDLHAQSAARD
jgi:hypothetical protein